jgi:hypothetical protein
VIGIWDGFFRDDAVGKLAFEVGSNDSKILLDELLLSHSFQYGASLRHALVQALSKPEGIVDA